MSVILYILNSLCIIPHRHTLSESTKRPYVLVIKAGMHQVFGVEKNYATFCMLDYGNYILR